MPRVTTYARVSSKKSEVWRKMVMRTRLRVDRTVQQPISEVVGERGKLAAVAAIALLRGRVGRKILKRLAMLSVFLVYEYLVVVEVAIALAVLVQLAVHVLTAVASKLPANRGNEVLEELTTAVVPVAGSAIPLAAGNRSRKRNAAQGLEDEIQRQLQELARATATPPQNRRECLVVEFPNRERTLAVPTSFGNRGSTELNLEEAGAPHKNRRNISEGPCQSLTVDRRVVIHFQLPIYVCDLTFWNDVRITIPSGPSNCGVHNCSASSSSGVHHAYAQKFVHIEMEMRAPELNREVIVLDRSRNWIGRNQCLQCGQTSHSVGKRKFECTHLDGQLELQKNSFHEGHRLTFLNDDFRRGGLNFKFETRLEQTSSPTPAERPQYSSGRTPRQTDPTTVTFKQQATFELLPPTLPRDHLQSNQDQSSKVEGKDKKQGGSGLLNYIKRNMRNNTQGPVTPVSKCYAVAFCTLSTRPNFDT